MNELKQYYQQKLPARVYALSSAKIVLVQHEAALAIVHKIAATFSQVQEPANLSASAQKVLSCPENELNAAVASLLQQLTTYAPALNTENRPMQIVMANLQQAQHILRQTETLSEALATITRMAHDLRGSGGTYGFPEISALAAQVEDAPRPELLARLKTLLQTLRETSTQDNHRIQNILLIEDDPDIAKIVTHSMASDYLHIFEAATATEADNILKTLDVSLIMLDLVLPDTDGRNFLRTLKTRPATANIPVFVVTGKGLQPSAECFSLGADGYFEKPFDPLALSAAVTAKLQKQIESQSLAQQDTLTALPNRAAFYDAYKRYTSMAQRQQTPLSLAILDLDHFKHINDTYGHAMGDDVLKRVAQILTATLRPADIVARWGGEEFVLLFPDTNLSGAEVVLNRAKEAVCQEKFTVTQPALTVSFSAGITAVAPEQWLEDAVAEADQKLYLAKASGRNRIVADEQPVLLPSQDHMLLLEDDELVASMVVHRFQSDGFKVMHVANGLDALPLLESQPFAAIILDVKTPGIDGFEVLQHIRSQAHWKQVPVVMLTSMGNEKNILRGLELGADDYILKPFSPTELQARVYRCLKRTT